MRVEFHISRSEQDLFESSLEAVLLNVDKATKRSTTQACEEILEESLKQVPRDTGTLASTAFYDVARNRSTKRYTYQGVVGYAGTAGAGASYDKLNPKSGAKVSSYAVRVHEDLDAKHPNGGKAKFLEDPVRAYGTDNFSRVAETNWRHAIDASNAGTNLTRFQEVTYVTFNKPN